MLYKYRYRATLIFFIAILVLSNWLFGYTGCRDGWSSPSIGSRGACSHHGGVTSNFSLLFMASGLLSFFFYSFAESRYRVSGNIVVLKNLPPHPREKEVDETRDFSLYPVPTGQAKSRKDFTCSRCKSDFKGGTLYHYLVQRNHRIKYCTGCSEALHTDNAMIEEERIRHYEDQERLISEINEYYMSNAKAILD